MKLRIGLDFDNTIANYDLAFPKVAELLGLETEAKSKRDLKRELQNFDGGVELWQKIQGQTYGRYINFASLYEGFLEFVFRGRAEGHDIFIVSHKTQFGHFDDSQTPLRANALSWLKAKQVVGDSPIQVNQDNIFFASTQNEKIAVINNLQLDYFIDDLEEILSHKLFSSRVKKVLLSSEEKSNSDIEVFKSWREIAAYLLGDVSNSQVQTILENFWPSLNCKKVDKVDGQGNSKIFKVETALGELVLKVYPDLIFDSRQRRSNEWAALKLMNEVKMQTPSPVETDTDLNWTMFEWIRGEPAGSNQVINIDRAGDFVRALMEISKSVLRESVISFATESCLAPVEVERQILTRVEVLRSIKDRELQEFLDLSLVPAINVLTTKAKAILDDGYYRLISPEYWILSPSDFGLHNAVTTENKDLVFFDFEYFGWDDPVKLTADFCLHPAMNLSQDFQRLWLKNMHFLFRSEPEFALRLRALFPLYAVRWSLIILNEYRADKLKNRVNAQDTISADVQRAKSDQLKKAKQMLKNMDSWSQIVS